MKQLSSIIGWLLLTIGFGLYTYGVGYAIFQGCQDPKNILPIPEPFDSVTSTIGAILLANFGAVLGISTVQRSSGLAARTLFTYRQTSDSLMPSLDKRELVQLIAVVVYIIVLVACTIAWMICTSKGQAVAGIVSQNGKSLIGVIAAYLAFVLGVKSDN